MCPVFFCTKSSSQSPLVLKQPSLSSVELLSAPPRQNMEMVGEMVLRMMSTPVPWGKPRWSTMRSSCFVELPQPARLSKRSPNRRSTLFLGKRVCAIFHAACQFLAYCLYQLINRPCAILLFFDSNICLCFFSRIRQIATSRTTVSSKLRCS